MVSYAATTEGITIAVRPVYLDGDSEALGGRFVFAYFVRIENDAHGEVQLLRRHWIITDSTGKRTEVEGEGVVGEQPVLGPGDVHEYQSFCVLETFTGTMEGSYLMQRENGERFRAQIPRFYFAARAN
ncbi:MAG: Co2+/Mg2+ efflux protein ApaG [Bacteroidota bacterium]